MFTIVHDHPCKPTVCDGNVPATSFTYDCSCGRLMIVRGASKTLNTVFGKEYFMLVEGRLIKPNYIKIG